MNDTFPANEEEAWEQLQVQKKKCEATLFKGGSKFCFACHAFLTSQGQGWINLQNVLLEI